MLILIVDDEAGMRWILSRILLQEGFQVRVARTAMEGLQIIQKEAVSAAIINYHLPGLNGFQLLTLIQRQGWQIPSLLITAYGSQQLEEAALEAGFHACIQKPFDNQRLIDQLHQALGSP